MFMLLFQILLCAGVNRLGLPEAGLAGMAEPVLLRGGEGSLWGGGESFVLCGEGVYSGTLWGCEGRGFAGAIFRSRDIRCGVGARVEGGTRWVEGGTLRVDGVASSTQVLASQGAGGPWAGGLEVGGIIYIIL